MGPAFAVWRSRQLRPSVRPAAPAPVAAALADDRIDQSVTRRLPSATSNAEHKRRPPLLRAARRDTLGAHHPVRGCPRHESNHRAVDGPRRVDRFVRRRLGQRDARGAGGASSGDSLATDGRAPDAIQILIGALTNFFDTLGIGSFAATTAVFRLQKMVPDRIIPGTLNVGHTLPTVAQAFIYTAVIPVDVVTLFCDDRRGHARRVARRRHRLGWSKQRVQFGMGAALLVAATLMFITQLQAMTGSRFLPSAAKRSACAARGSWSRSPGTSCSAR